MTDLIPLSIEAAEELEAKVVATNLFKSTDDFITFYNSGFISKTAPEINDLANEVDATFKNVELQMKHFVFISETEVYLAELLRQLSVWEAISKLQRVLKTLESEERISSTSLLGFAASSNAVIQEVELTDGVHMFGEKLSVEKFFKSSDLLDTAVESYPDTFKKVDGGVMFTASDVVDLDSSFIAEMHEKM